MRLVATLALVAVSACGGADATQELTVFAAASLTEAFTELGERFEASEPGLRVAFNFAASSALATQIEQGARADVFASADEASMRRVADAVREPVVFARNRLVIVVADGNPGNVRTLTELRHAVTVLCISQAPCGRGADTALAAAGVRLEAASREENVKAVLTRVRLGEADAGIVYVTDVRDGVGAITIPDEHNVVASYPIAVLREASQPEAARRFVSTVRSSDELARHGFLPAP